MRAPIEALFMKVPNDSIKIVFGSTAYVHIHKPNHASESGNHSQKEICLGNRDGLYRVQVLNAKIVVEITYTSFNERHLIFS